jgi:hypothetical protein
MKPTSLGGIVFLSAAFTSPLLMFAQPELPGSGYNAGCDVSVAHELSYPEMEPMKGCPHVG